MGKLFAPVPLGQTTTPWAVVLKIPVAVITEKALQLSVSMIVFGLILLIISLLILWLVVTRIVQPLKKITLAARAIATGDISQNITYHSFDEIGHLADAFREITDYFRGISQVAVDLAHYDLTKDVEARSEKDVLGLAFAQMLQGLRFLVNQVKDSANDLNNASSQLASAAMQAGQATNQISMTIQQVAKGITQQSEAVNKTASSADQMERAINGVAKGAQEQSTAVARASDLTSQISTAIQQVSTHAQTSAHGASQAAETAREGARTIEETIRGMQSIKAKVGLSAEKVQEMGRRSDQIGAIVETIDDIASQTNLLALNAAIEAARAGEHGKGFSVVADEVRKLAERSRAATKEIGGLIKGIQQTVGEAVKAMNEGANEVENGVTRAGQSGEALTSILKAAELVSRQVEEIAGAAQQISASSNELVTSMDSVSAVVEENTASTEQMSASSTEVTQAVESIASVSEENSAAVEEVSAGTEEMSAQVQEVTASAATLADMAHHLADLVDKFRLNP